MLKVFVKNSNSFFFVTERCDIPLGSEDGRLPDVAFTASSIYNAHYAAYQGRLNAMRSGSKFGSWIARYNNRRQWFQIDLGNKAIVIKIGIQGRYDANQWVKTYTIAYGMNGFHFRFYKEGGRTRVCLIKLILKELGHAILGNFSTDQLIVIELTKISK